jgi:4-hydroxy-3-methylbut-2-enyl diphosphate reductase
LMALTVEIDPGSGFCGGVIRAISKAEEYLGKTGRLYSLGAIVHNEAELARLESKGLVTVGYDDLGSIGSGTVLIRAHGEPPETYWRIREASLDLVDCTCPVVLGLQRKIRDAHSRLTEGGRHGKIVIFGKIGHAEVLGLVGQVGGDALVVENARMLENAFAEGLIDPDGGIEVFSQTTKDPDGYKAVCDVALSRAGEGTVTIHKTICSQVASRHRELSAFAAAHDVIIFVSGKSSSNGKVLFDLCKAVNPNTFHIQKAEETDPAWFSPGMRVGICGATSTPKWLLEEVARAVQKFG